jgi:hypothetical protein
MPYEIRWEENGGVYLRFWGWVSKEELQRPRQEIAGDSRGSQLRYDITDFSDVTKYDVTAFDALLLAAKDHYMSYQYLAIITTNEGIKDLASKYAKSPLMTKRDVCIFSNLSDARSWVSLCLSKEAKSSGQ